MADEAHYTYEGYHFEVKPCCHVVFNFECYAMQEGKQTLKGFGVSEDAALDHAKILVTREISKIGM